MCINFREIDLFDFMRMPFKNNVYTNANDNLLLKIKGFDNDVIRCFRKCCTCCLWCLEKFMKFVNRNIYIMTAIKGIIIF